MGDSESEGFNTDQDSLVFDAEKLLYEELVKDVDNENYANRLMIFKVLQAGLFKGHSGRFAILRNGEIWHSTYDDVESIPAEFGYTSDIVLYQVP